MLVFLFIKIFFCENTLPFDHIFTHIIHAAADVVNLPSYTPWWYHQIVVGARNVLILPSQPKQIVSYLLWGNLWLSIQTYSILRLEW